MVGGHEEGALLARGHAVERIEQAREGDLVGMRVGPRASEGWAWVWGEGDGEASSEG